MLSGISVKGPDIDVEISGRFGIAITGNYDGRQLVRGVPIGEFGLTADGHGYYQTGGANDGEAAALGYNVNTGVLSLTRRDS